MYTNPFRIRARLIKKKANRGKIWQIQWFCKCQLTHFTVPSWETIGAYTVVAVRTPINHTGRHILTWIGITRICSYVRIENSFDLVLVFPRGGEGDGGYNHRLVLPVWRAQTRRFVDPVCVNVTASPQPFYTFAEHQGHSTFLGMIFYEHG